MSNSNQSGSLTPILPESRASKPKKIWVWLGAGLGLLLVCCLAVAAIVYFERDRIFGTGFRQTEAPQLTLGGTATPALPPTPALAPISGHLEADSDSTPVADRRIVLCARLNDADLECQLTELVAASDADGDFEFPDVPAGRYLVFYDSGWSDFDAGLAKWQGKSIMVGDVQWLAENFFEADASGQYNFWAPAGTLLDLRLLAYRFLVQSPFFWAYNCGSGSCNQIDDIQPVEFDVSDGSHQQETFTVYYYSGSK